MFFAPQENFYFFSFVLRRLNKKAKQASKKNDKIQ